MRVTGIRDRNDEDGVRLPVLLRTSTKLGYKNAKWIKATEVMNEFRETYWSKRGLN
jgi:DMSO/TMAO reductase YedYZ molybdopterin-dependent catalytic subunit